ncbi:MAG: class I SAM-dependent methyltransferase [Acidobacteriota bacterium]|nr:class I SAM-dependent methyltransferase [Acidobacteriota bacterium]
MSTWRREPVKWFAYRLGLKEARTQTTEAERACLSRHALGRRNVVVIGVAYGVSSRVLRRAMHRGGTLTGIDTRRPGPVTESVERLIMLKEVGKVPYGHFVLEQRPSAEVAAGWTTPIDFLFIDGDHSWTGIDTDWRSWSPLVVRGGLVGVHDSREMPGRPVLDSVRYTREVILQDPAFTVLEMIDGLTILERIAAVPPATRT